MEKLFRPSGELDIKLRNNVINLLRFLPKWKVIVYILISLILSAATGAILLPTLEYLEDSSRFFESLLFVVSYFPRLIVFAYYITTTGLFLFFIYQYERKRYLAFYLKRMTEQVQLIAEGKSLSIDMSVQPEFQACFDGIKKIIAKSEEAIIDVKNAEQLKNELVTNVAHDLRSPLTSIIGYLELINNDGYQDEVELRYYIQVIHEKAASLHTLINDIFEYTFMQNHQTIIQKDPVNLEEMLNQLAVLSRVQLEEVEMMFRLFSSVTNPIILGDGGKLARVFENLIQNAIRYGSDGKYLDVYLDETEKSIEIEIVNYGQQSIPPSDLPNIFERFYRVEKSRSHFSGGSGLGLAIAKNIIDLHNGEIKAISKPGRTAFKIVLLKK